MKNNHVTTLQIDLNSVGHNLDYFKSKLKNNTKILVVVKAFGYGSDAVEIAKSIQEQVDYFAVAYTHEGVSLRSAGITTPIMVLHPQVENLELLASNNLEPNLYNSFVLSGFLELAKKNNFQKYPIHLKFNTGLNRLGFSENDMDYLHENLSTNNHISIASVFSHLAASEDEKERLFSLGQIECFKNIKNTFQSKFGFTPMCHMCNTSGIINYPEAHFDMVRLGIGLYGFANHPKETAKLKNVISLYTVISQIHEINSGESIGYNRGYKSTKAMKSATIAIGHADGIPRSVGNGKGFVTINEKKAPILGNVCMDMMMVDISKIDCKVGDQVILYDNQETVVYFAKQANTISYEWLTAISQRVRRLIVKS
ncbi:MAG: alanine racemase [Flavobacteriaceae bacterium]|nr:alanine racemase [Flavobacteriaceae bacterium]